MADFKVGDRVIYYCVSTKITETPLKRIICTLQEVFENGVLVSNT